MELISIQFTELARRKLQKKAKFDKIDNPDEDDNPPKLDINNIPEEE